MGEIVASASDFLRNWRHRRRLSQLDCGRLGLAPDHRVAMRVVRVARGVKDVQLHVAAHAQLVRQRVQRALEP